MTQRLGVCVSGLGATLLRGIAGARDTQWAHFASNRPTTPTSSRDPVGKAANWLAVQHPRTAFPPPPPPPIGSLFPTWHLPNLLTPGPPSRPGPQHPAGSRGRDRVRQKEQGTRGPNLWPPVAVRADPTLPRFPTQRAERQSAFLSSLADTASAFCCPSDVNPVTK